MGGKGRRVWIGRRVCADCAHAVVDKDAPDRVKCAKDQWASLKKSDYTLDRAWFTKWRGAPFRPQTEPREPLAERCIFYASMIEDDDNNPAWD